MAARMMPNMWIGTDLGWASRTAFSSAATFSLAFCSSLFLASSSALILAVSSLARWIAFSTVLRVKISTVTISARNVRTV